ncbi:Coiled-coil domain-containing protein 91 [Fukomys damarensis]|uniref:Coiled-coil domain-containing protein 91 n=1 Tax=Fukomys damarensis TaxID=885580 RepID=A0A091CLU1_FUKDA|nr:Coiled-coil domain-containing protein 91 [Fukomys damarensis]
MWNKISRVHLSPSSPELVLDHDHLTPSVGCLSLDAIVSSPENVHKDDSIVSGAVLKVQVQQSALPHLDILFFPLGLLDETSDRTIAFVDDSAGPAGKVSNIQLQQKVLDLEMKLKMSEEEKQRIKKDVESLMEKHSILEKDVLKEKEQETISFQDRCEELLNAQHKRILEMLDREKELLKEKNEALNQRSQEQKEILEICLEEDRQRNKETESATKLEQEAMKEVVMKAIKEERKNLEKAHAEEREL